MVDSGIGQRIIKEEVGVCHKMGSRELEEDRKSGNAIVASQLEGPQYKLTRGNARYSSSRTKKIIESNGRNAKRNSKGRN